MYKPLIVFAVFVLTGINGNAQSRSFTDPAQMYNRLLLEKPDMITRVGNFKVQGTPYLYGGKLAGTVYAKSTTPTSTFIGYDTYNQVLQYATTAEGDYITPTEVIDSFIVKQNAQVQLTNDTKFISSSIIGGQDKGYYQVVFDGPKYVLYKYYKSALGIVSTNYVQSDLRQFDLNYEYYYRDVSQNKIKKIKANTGAIKKEFKNIPAAADAATNDDFSYTPEAALIKVFTVVNQ